MKQFDLYRRAEIDEDYRRLLRITDHYERSDGPIESDWWGTSCLQPCVGPVHDPIFTPIFTTAFSSFGLSVTAAATAATFASAITVTPMIAGLQEVRR